jgi:hypothetical protein
MAWHNKPNPAKTPQVAVPKAPTPKPATAKPIATKPVHPHHPKPPHHKPPHATHLSMPKANAKPVQPHSTHKVVTVQQKTPDIIVASKVHPPKKK